MHALDSKKVPVLLQLLPAMDAGGVERGTLELSKAVVSRGWESHVISAAGRLVPCLQNDGGFHHAWNIGEKNPWTLRFLPRLMRFCRTYRVDVLHARSRLPAWIAYLAWCMMPGPSRPLFVTTVHGLNSVNPYSRIMTRGEHVIAVSETARDYILEHYPSLAPDKLEVIYRGTDNSEFQRGYHPSTQWLQSWWEAFPLTRHARLLTLPGRISTRKGHLDFLKLVHAMRETDPSIMGVIVGDDGGGRQEKHVRMLKSYITQNNMQDAIVWTGHRSDMKEIYAISDLVCSLSNKPESFGRTILEALCIGTRCVGLDHGGVGEILAKMFPSGKLVLDETPEQWARICHRLLDPQSPRPETNVFPLQGMLDLEIQCYHRWMRGHESPAR
ncbi:MAG: glycosyltransferase [Verrucomicrobiota bacterium]|nr:glycosyltransferase [Verrucomicrobiota bacterium]